MPHFFFDVIAGEERIDDVEGQTLPDLDSARLAAIRVARETRDLIGDLTEETLVLEIRDAEGNLIEHFHPFPDK